MKIKLILIFLIFFHNITFAKTNFEKRFEKDLRSKEIIKYLETIY